MLHPLILRFPAYSRAIPQEEQAVVAAISRMIASRICSIFCGLRRKWAAVIFLHRIRTALIKESRSGSTLFFCAAWCYSTADPAIIEVQMDHSIWHPIIRLIINCQSLDSPFFPENCFLLGVPSACGGRITGKIPRQAGSTPTGTPSCPHKDSFPGWVARSQWYYLPTFSSPMTPSPSHHYLSDIIAHSCWIRLMA